MVKPKVVTIMGAGHSGSTPLAIVLGNHSNISSVGELHKLPRSGWTRDENRRCACGSRIHECGFWGDIYGRWIERVGQGALGHYIELQDTFERSSLAWARLMIESKRCSRRFATYAEMTAALYEAIRGRSARGVIVDSSKSPVRNYALLLNPHLDVRFIHLIRDGRGVVWSLSRPRSRDIEAGVPKARHRVSPWRTSLHWTGRNLQSEFVGRCAGDQKILRITYETFVQDPSMALEKLTRLVDEDLTQLASALLAGGTMDVGHIVGGNRLRMSGSVVLRPDFEWTRKLPKSDNRTFWWLAGWQAQRYGYKR